VIFQFVYEKVAVEISYLISQFVCEFVTLTGDFTFDFFQFVCEYAVIEVLYLILNLFVCVQHMLHARL
jgi:hypothetical protein